MGDIQTGICLFVTFLLFHQTTCQIAAIAITLPYIVTLLENVTKTLSPALPEIPASLENQRNAQMVTVDLLEKHDQLLDNITKQLSQQNQILTSMTTLMQRQTERIQHQAIAQDCTDILDQGFNEDYGTYTIKPPDKLVSFEVICDLNTKGGGWIVFQKRTDGTEDFNRPWKDYKNGFGETSTGHWLGLEKLHRLTKNGVWQLRVDLEESSGNTSFVQYANFSIGNEATNYRLMLGEHTGFAGDIMANHSDKPFSTFDRDNDESTYNCAEESEMAWWFESCHGSTLQDLNLETPLRVGRHIRLANGRTAEMKVLEMKIRQICKSSKCYDPKATTQQATTTASAPAQTTPALTTSSVMTTSTPSLTTPPIIGHDCSAVLDQELTENYGIYRIQPSDVSEYFSVVCDLETDGGGWVVFQRRYDGSEDFKRPWQDYKDGFGNMTGEFWLGLEKVHQLTSDGVWKLRVDLEDFSGNTAYAEYSDFTIGDESTKYRLSYDGYSGTAGTDDSLAHSNNCAFTTYDQDNDAHSSLNCAQYHQGAWWHGTCTNSNLNGLYTGSSEVNNKGMSWYYWKNRYEVLKKSEMKIRRAW